MENTETNKTEEAASKGEEPTVTSDSQQPTPVSTTTANTTTTAETTGTSPSVPESGTLAPEPTAVPEPVRELTEADLNTINELNRAALSEMETTELRVKIICLEKNNMALKMELKCAELQLEAKLKVDAQKTKLIDLLDGKVTSLQKKNIHLMDMLEGLLKQKDTHSHRLIDATNQMERLAAKLTESERMRTELRNMNQELKTMLGNIEDKGSQIAKLAKEKILKYKDEAVKVQQELDDMKKSAANGEQADKFTQNWKKIEDLQLQLANAFQGESTGDVAEKLTTTNEIKQELEQLRAELNSQLNANQGENDKLRSELDSMRLLVVDLQQLSKENEVPTNSVEATKDTNVSADIVAKDLEISQLKEKLGQLHSTIIKLADLSAASSVK